METFKIWWQKMTLSIISLLVVLHRKTADWLPETEYQYNDNKKYVGCNS